MAAETAITQAGNDAFRDYVVEGVPASGYNDPVKAAIRGLIVMIDAALSSLGAVGAITVKKTTQALLLADLAHAEGTLAIVYADTTSAKNGIYAKVGASGAGTWTITGLTLPASFAGDLADALAQLEQLTAAVNAADESASEAADSAAAAQAAQDIVQIVAGGAGVYAYYDTKAAANAALAGIPANAVVQVFVDESFDDEFTVYKKVGGVLVLKVSQSFAGRDLANLDGGLEPGVNNQTKKLFATTSGYALSYGDPAYPEIDIRDVAEDMYGPGGYSFRTATATTADFGTGTDWGLVAAEAFDRLHALPGGRGILKWPAANYSIRTPIPASKQSGNIWLGDGEAKSQLFYDTNTDALFNFSGAAGYTGGGVRGFTVYLGQGQGKTNAVVLNCVGDATYQPDSTAFANVRATAEAFAGAGESYWIGGGNIVATSRTAPQGVRDCSIENFHVFKCWGYSWSFYNLVQWVITNIGGYTPYTQTGTGAITNGSPTVTMSAANPLILPGMACRGTGVPPGTRVLTVVGATVTLNSSCTVTNGTASLSFTSGDEIFIGGGGTSTTNTTQAYFRGIYAAGELNLTNSRVVSINGFTCDIVRADPSFDRYGLDGEPANGLVGTLGTTGAARLGAVRYKNGSVVT